MLEKRGLTFVISGSALIILAIMLLASSGAEAQAVTGDWISNVSGEGFILDSWPADFHYDVALTLNPGGSGSITTRCSRVTNVQPDWEEAYANVGKSLTQNVTYTMSGSGITLNIGTIACQATISGNKMTGSGSYYDPQTTMTYIYTIDLIKSGGWGGGGVGDLGLPDLTVPAAGAAVAVAAIGLGASLMSPPKIHPMAPRPGSTAPSYQQGSMSQTTEIESGPPDAGVSTGGIGLHWPSLLDQNGNPYPPRKYESQYGPTCPIHGNIPCQAKFPYQDQSEPGSWYCQRCFDENRSYYDENRRYTGNRDRGYPWGSYRP